MVLKNIEILQIQAEKIVQEMQKIGISKEQCKSLVENKYLAFEDEEDIVKNGQSIILPHININIVQNLYEGYTFSEMKQSGVSDKEIEDFKLYLKHNNLSINQVLAFNAYSADSKLILSTLRGVSGSEILKSIKIDMKNRLKEIGLNDNDIQNVEDFVLGLNYTDPLHLNYEKTKQFFTKKGFSKSQIIVFNTYVLKMNDFFKLPSTIENLQEGLKNNSKENVVLYRAVKSSFIREKFGLEKDNFAKLVGKTISDSGFTSTSLLYDTSFAKYKEYDIVYEIYAPKGTQCTSITSFSNYGNVEYEVLCNSNDLVITGVDENFIDKFGNSKIKLSMIMKNKSKDNLKSLDCIGKER